jgi:hypothetical protein
MENNMEQVECATRDRTMSLYEQHAIASNPGFYEIEAHRFFLEKKDHDHEKDQNRIRKEKEEQEYHLMRDAFYESIELQDDSPLERYILTMEGKERGYILTMEGKEW